MNFTHDQGGKRNFTADQLTDYFAKLEAKS